MIDIKPEILSFLQERVDKLKRHKKTHKHCSDVTSLVNHVLKKYVRKKKLEELASNQGIDWLIFCNVHKNKIFIRDKGRCYYCNKRLTLKESTLDHKLPVKRSGTNTVENVVTSCKWCNQDKGMLTDEEYQYKQLHNAAQGISPSDS